MVPVRLLPGSFKILGRRLEPSQNQVAVVGVSLGSIVEPQQGGCNFDSLVDRRIFVVVRADVRLRLQCREAALQQGQRLGGFGPDRSGGRVKIQTEVRSGSISMRLRSKGSSGRAVGPISHTT